MKNKNKIIKSKYRDSRVSIFIFSFLVLLGLGCAGTHKTTTTETTVSYPNKGMINQEESQTSMKASTSNDQSENRGMEKTEITTTLTETKAEQTGVLGATLHAIGYVISLPFIIVGGLFKIIFGG